MEYVCHYLVARNGASLGMYNKNVPLAIGPLSPHETRSDRLVIGLPSYGGVWTRSRESMDFNRHLKQPGVWLCEHVQDIPIPVLCKADGTWV